MTKLVPWQGFEASVRARVGRGYIGDPAEFRVGLGDETVTLPSGGTVRVDLTEAEADAALREIKVGYDRLRAEVAALDAFLARVRGVIEQYQLWKAGYNSPYEMYMAEFRSQIATKTRGQDLIQKIKDNVNRAGVGSVTRYGFGGIPAVILLIAVITAALTTTAVVTVWAVGRVKEQVAGETEAQIRARQEARSTLEAAIRSHPTMTGEQKAKALAAVETLANRPVQLGFGVIAVAGLIAFLVGGGGGFFVGRGTK